MSTKPLPFILILIGNIAFGQTTIHLTTPTTTTAGPYNTMVGVGSGDLTSAEGNAFFGYQAGTNNKSGNNNIYIGSQAGFRNTSSNNNIFIGTKAGFSNDSGEGNVFIGNNTGKDNVIGRANTYIGASAGSRSGAANSNTFIGNSAGLLTYTGHNNVFVGAGSGSGNDIGQSNTFVGYYAGSLNDAGKNNAFLGANTDSGRKSNKITLLGSGAKVLYVSDTDPFVNATAIGAEAIVSANNAIVLGDTTQNTKVGIGITAPQFPLDVRGTINIRGNGTLKFSHLSNPAYQNGQTDQVLTVDANGETVLAKVAKMEEVLQELIELRRENKELRQRLEKVERGNQVITGKD